METRHERLNADFPGKGVPCLTPQLHSSAPYHRRRGTENRTRRPKSGSLFEKASSLYREAVIKYQPVSDIAALQPHDKVEIRLGRNRPSRPLIVGSKVHR